MCPAIEAVMFVWEDLCENYNLAAMAMSETGTLDRKLLDEVAEIVKLRLPFVPGIAEVFAMFAEVISRFGSKLEGCHCHAQLWIRKRKHESKVNELERLTGFRHCTWKGRRAAW